MPTSFALKSHRVAISLGLLKSHRVANSLELVKSHRVAISLGLLKSHRVAFSLSSISLPKTAAGGGGVGTKTEGSNTIVIACVEILVQ